MSEISTGTLVSNLTTVTPPEGPSAAQPSPARTEIVIRPPGSAGYLDFRELYQYRHLLWNLVWRNVKVQFEDMSLGLFWATIRPLLMVAVLTGIRNLSTAVSIPYALYLYSGFILWFYFAEASMQTATCVRRDAGLISKIYFPRLITPLTPVLANIVNLGIALIPLVPMLAYYRIHPGWELILLPLVLVQCMALTLGVGTVFAALSIENRDYEKVLSLFLYVGMFMSPVFFSTTHIPGARYGFAFVNPLVGSLLAFRSCLFADPAFPWWEWAYSCAVSLAFVAVGVYLYRRAEGVLAERL
jgi:lipopolysaccharide transport system permease protein